MTEQHQQKCIHDILDNGIHKFTLSESSMAGAEAYLAELETLYAARTATSPTLRVLLDPGLGGLPINFTMQRGKELIAKYPNVGIIRTALLSDKTVAVHMVNSLLRVARFPHIQTSYFTRTHQNDAIQWLLKDE